MHLWKYFSLLSLNTTKRHLKPFLGAYVYCKFKCKETKVHHNAPAGFFIFSTVDIVMIFNEKICCQGIAEVKVCKTLLLKIEPRLN